MRIRELANRHIRDLEPYHGGKPIDELERELGISGSIKLASNESPVPPSESVIEAIQAAAAQLNRYPDGHSHELRRRLSMELELPPEQLFLGAGSDEILEVLVKCFLQPGDQALFPWPSFAMYPIVTQGMGASAVRVPLDDDLVIDVDALVDAVTEHTRILFLANPNNPTGTSIDAEAFARLLLEIPQRVVIVNDEAYLEYVRRSDFPDARRALAQRPTLVTLRTFSKIYGLAGLRLGYAFGHPELIDLLERARHPFNVNHLAQIAGCAALEDREHVARVRQLTQRGLERLERGLDALQLDYARSDANFILVKLGPAAAQIQQSLLRAGVITRSMAAFGLPEHLRISIGLPHENKRLLDELTRLVGETAR